MSGNSGRMQQRARGSAGEQIRAQRLRERYCLTMQEVRVAVLVAEGHTVQEIANRLEVTVFTIRAHLRNIFAKTAVNRQAALVRIVLAGQSGRTD